MRTTLKVPTRDYGVEGARVLREYQERQEAARQRRIENDAAYRVALGVPPGAPLPKTLGKAESNGRPLFTRNGIGERHATRWSPDRDLGERTD